MLPRVSMESSWGLRGVSVESSRSPCRFFVDSTESSWTPWKPVGERKVLNDYWMLNTNTILDAHLLLHVDDILADCAKGQIWSKLDMMNSFFQTRVPPDNIHLTAVTTPFGLYEWLTMPLGLWNSPPIHQQ